MQNYNTMINENLLNCLKSNCPLIRDKATSGFKNFSWIHMGESDLRIGFFEDLLHRFHQKLPRTGHLGNWKTILKCIAGALDYNGYVCNQNLAYPYIYDLTQTENNDLTSGDTVYMVGSLIEGGQRSVLELYTWDILNKRFKKANRNYSYYAPFVMVKPRSGDQLIPLTSYHKNLIDNDNITYQSSLIMDNSKMLIVMLRNLLTKIYQKKTSLKLRDIVDRVIYKNGQISRVPVSIEEEKIIIGDLEYANINELTKQILIPIKAASNPEWFHDNIKELNDEFPLFSLAFLSSFDLILMQKKIQSEIVIYCEWGAFGTAAYPPRNKGYYRENASKIKKIITTASVIDTSLSKVLFLLFPAVIYNILPNSMFPQDAAIVDQLLTEILYKAGSSVEEIESSVSKWWLQNRSGLSDYYISRFSERRCAINTHTIDSKQKCQLNLDLFRKLSFKQAAIIIGGIFEAEKHWQTR